MTKELAKTLGDAARTHRFTMVGDSSHTDLQVLKAFGQRENFEVLRGEGVKHLFMEVPRDVQWDLNKFLDGKITEPQMVERLTKAHKRAQKNEEGDLAFNAEVIRIAKLAHDSGMKVHFADNRQEFFKNLRRRGGDYEQYATSSQGYMKDFDEFLVDRFTKKMPDGSRVTPYTNDRPLGEFIAGKVGRDKAVIFYGMGHGRQSYDLDEILGERQTARVEILSSKEDALSKVFDRLGMHTMNMTIDKDKPYARYYIDTNTVERFPEKPAAEMTAGEVELEALEVSKAGLNDKPAAKAKAAPAARPAKGHSLPKP